MTYKIKENVRIFEVTENISMACSEKSGILLKSDIARKIIKIVAERSVSKEELLKDFNPESINEAVISLHQLEKEGLITSKPTAPIFTAEKSAFWTELGYDVHHLANIFSDKKVQVKCVGEVSSALFESAGKATGLQFLEMPDLYVVITDSYLHKKLQEYNQQFLKNKIPWLLIKTTGTKPMIGPLFNTADKETPCWACLQHRLLLHDRENKLYQALKNTEEVLKRPLIHHPLSENMVVQTAILEIVFWLYHENSPLKNKLFSIDVKTGERSTHHVVKRPQCSVCGNDELLTKELVAIELQKQKREVDVAGGYRSVPAEETLNKYQHHVSQITGIVPCLTPYKKIAEAPIYNFSSGRNMALQSSSMFWLNQHLRSANGGKGKTEIQAKVGALCESIERYSLIYNNKTYTVKGRFAELDNALHPNGCMLYSQKQYKSKEQTNKQSSRFYGLIPDVFDKDEVMDWTPVYSLTNKDFRLLPSEYCYAQYPIGDRQKVYAYPDSNGSAAGNTIEEAILQGLLELVERDAAAIWWYNELQMPAVDLSSANNPYINKMVQFYKTVNRSLYVLDITTDMDIPVFVAISHNLLAKSNDEVVYAFGAHVDASIALERAIVELNQLSPIVLAKNEKVQMDREFEDWLKNSDLKQQQYLIPAPVKYKNLQKDYPKLCEASIYDGLQYCINRAEANQLEVLVLNLTQPDIGLPVTRVIVPGLRHFWRRTAPGRLYQVPVKMKWLSKPKTEEELNPLSITI